MLSVQPLHAIVLGLCEKVGRHDGTWLWHGTTEERNSAVGRGCRNPPSPCYPQPGVSAQLKPWQHFTLMRDFSLPLMWSIRRVKVKCLPLTQCKWQNAQSDRMHGGKTNKAERLSVHLGGLLMKSVAQKSLAIFLLNTLI